MRFRASSQDQGAAPFCLSPVLMLLLLLLLLLLMLPMMLLMHSPRAFCETHSGASGAGRYGDTTVFGDTGESDKDRATRWLMRRWHVAPSRRQRMQDEKCFTLCRVGRAATTSFCCGGGSLPLQRNPQ